MKQFSLDEYLRNPKMKVVTRYGRPVKIHCVNFRQCSQPVIAEVEGAICSNSYGADGRFLYNKDSDDDLFYIPDNQKGVINILRGLLKGTAKIKIEWKE